MGKSALVKDWFGDEFYNLDPLLQHLHIHGGVLSGNVRVDYGRGVAGLIGKRLSRKMNLPEAGVHKLTVEISHHEDGLHWYRRFGKDNEVRSIFKPVGHKDSGYWEEITGPVTMKLTVDIKNGGWYWRCLNVRVFRCPLPLWLVPRLQAYKLVEQGQYRFSVEMSFNKLGRLVSYGGLLNK